MSGEVAARCVHHWVLASTEALPMTQAEKLRHPYCIKRQGRCKKCGEEREQLERVSTVWRDQ